MVLRPSLRSTLLAFALLAPTALAGGGAASGAHPHFDDRGTLTWYPTMAQATEAARAQGKVILMEAGRRRCSQCRVLCCNVLPSCNVRPRLSRIAVGLASNCDAMEPAVDALVRRHLSTATTLPFVAFLRADGSWITGFSGGRSEAQFLSDLAVAERAFAESSRPVVAAAPASAGCPAASAPKPCHAQAETAARRGAWGEVVRLCREADSRDEVMARMRARAREWADTRLTQAVAAAGETRYQDAETAAGEVRSAMAGEAEAADAQRGLDALRRAREIDTLSPESTEFAEAKKKAREELAGTRWERLFA
jgi:hypothetical protein